MVCFMSISYHIVEKNDGSKSAKYCTMQWDFKIYYGTLNTSGTQSRVWVDDFNLASSLYHSFFHFFNYIIHFKSELFTCAIYI